MRDSPVETVKVSPKYQVVIPKKVRDKGMRWKNEDRDHSERF